jgi:hypothetical protein
VTKFKKILALSSYPNGNENLRPPAKSCPIGSFTPGKSYALSRVFKASYQLPDFISTSDLISIKTGLSLILKSCANAYCKLFSAAFIFPDSLLIKADKT